MHARAARRHHEGVRHAQRRAAEPRERREDLASTENGVSVTRTRQNILKNDENAIEYTRHCLKHPEHTELTSQHNCKRFLYLLTSKVTASAVLRSPRPRGR